MANILIIMCGAARFTETVSDHLNSFKEHSSHKIIQIDSKALDRIDFDLNNFDCIVFHYSIVISLSSYISNQLTERLKLFSGPKILFIQDEMRWVDSTCAKIKELDIKTIFTVVNKSVIRKIYRDSWFDQVRFEQTLTGFVSENLVDRKVKPYEERNIDVSYRARKTPAWCGEFGRLKWKIGQIFGKDAPNYNLTCDLSSKEGDRLYGEKWIEFISDSKATLGVESGAGFIDFSGIIAPAVEKYERRHPDTPFSVLQEKFLEGRDGEIIIHVISPRCFEAAALRTLMIMYEGEYSGVLIPNRHYVVLNKDHSNMSDVVSIIKDPKKAKPFIDSAYHEIACSEKYTFKTFIKDFDRVVCEELEKVIPLQSKLIPNDTISLLEKKSEIIIQWDKIRLKIAIFLGNIYINIFRFIQNSSVPMPIKKIVLSSMNIAYKVLRKLFSYLLIR